MGFYGNITNTSNTTFQFDKIYSNRLTMEANTANDGIFVGRYVLVEYDANAAYPVIYTKDGKFYSADPGTQQQSPQIKYKGEKTEPDQSSTASDFYMGDIGQVQKQIQANGKTQYETTFYQCDGGSGGLATFKHITTVSSSAPYITNYSIDNAKYEETYDSTVWVKASTQQGNSYVSQYVKIAELNSVVPTFNLKIDRPTSVPLNPHFDRDSTNVDYFMHVQPQWGFRVATADREHSDADTQWIKYEYNTAEDVEQIKYASGIKADGTPNWNGNVNSKLPAAIYYNKKAFKPKGENGVITKHDDKTEDVIKITEAKSGNLYNDHNGKTTGYTESVQNDTQELTINLPAIGNMMSDAWDIIHGKQRDDYRGDGENASLQGRLDSFEALGANEIPIKRSADGQLVGTKINGNNNKTDSEISEILSENLSTSFVEDDAWIYTKIGENKIDDEHNDAIAIHHTFHKTSDSESQVDKNTGVISKGDSYKADNIPSNNLDNINNQKDLIELYTPYVDKAGHVVGKNIETVVLPYGYKHIEVNNDSGVFAATVSPDGTTQSADNTQDTIKFNSVNKWIQLDGNEEDTIKFGHLVEEISTDDVKNTDLNNNSDNINIPDWKYDEAGHIVEKHDHHYTLPFGYKYITTNGLNTSETQDLDAPKTETATANSTQDTFNIDTVNKWIQVEVTDNDNRIKIAHELHEITENVTTDTTDDLNNQKNNQVQNTVNIPDWSFDNAGHITHKSDRIYTLPYGYKTFTVSNSDTVGLHSVGNGTLVARNTRDDLAFITENNWIALEAIADNETGNKIYIGHKTNGNSFGKTYYAKEIESPENDAYKQEPKFGETAKILNVTVDNAGHVTAFNSNTITIPKGSYEAATDSTEASEIITSLGFTPETGKITSTKATTDTLKISGYEALTSVDNNGDLIDGHTVNEALGRLEYRIKDEEIKRKNAIDALYGNGTEKIAETFDTIKEIADWLDNNAETGEPGIEKLIGDIEKNSYDIEAEELRASAKEKELQNQITQHSTDINTVNSRCNVLDHEVKNLINKNVSIEETLSNNTATIGAIEKDLLDEIAIREEQINTLNSRCNVLDYEVKQLINKVAELTNKINELTVVQE